MFTSKRSTITTVMKTLAVLLTGLMAIIATPVAPASAQDATPPPAPTIAELALATPELSTLVTALSVATNAGPVDFLGVASDPAADLTVFAPTNAAFAALGPALDDVLADPSGALTNILLYHVLGTSETGADLAAAGTATTLLGDNVTIEVRNGNVFINNSQVVIADIQAANGIIHVIDTVLLPPTPEPSPIFEGARLNIVSAPSGRYLDGDASGELTNVDTSTSPRLDDEWILEPTADGYWRLLNAQRHLYLDADGRHFGFNVDLAPRHGLGTEWEITQLDNGNYLLRSIAYDRVLDYDANGNVDTSSTPKADDEWQLVLLTGH